MDLVLERRTLRRLCRRREESHAYPRNRRDGHHDKEPVPGRQLRPAEMRVDKLKEYGPYGFAKEGPEYAARIMDVAGRAAFGEMLEFDEAFCDKAAECGHRSFVIMAGALDGQDVEAKV